MPVEGRDLSSRRTQYVVRDLEIGQPINSERCSETAEGVARESEGRSRLSVLRPVRQDQPRGHPDLCLCSVPLQQGCTGCGWSRLRGHRSVWGATMAWRTGACAQAGDLPTGPHQKSVHTESQRQTQAAGHLDPAGSGLHDGSDAVLEPIFEADLPPEQYAYRSGRNAQQAVGEVGALLSRGHPEVVDADLADYL